MYPFSLTHKWGRNGKKETKKEKTNQQEGSWTRKRENNKTKRQKLCHQPSFVLWVSSPSPLSPRLSLACASVLRMRSRCNEERTLQKPRQKKRCSNSRNSSKLQVKEIRDRDLLGADWLSLRALIWRSLANPTISRKRCNEDESSLVESRLPVVDFSIFKKQSKHPQRTNKSMKTESLFFWLPKQRSLRSSGYYRFAIRTAAMKTAGRRQGEGCRYLHTTLCSYGEPCTSMAVCAGLSFYSMQLLKTNTRPRTHSWLERCQRARQRRYKSESEIFQKNEYILDLVEIVTQVGSRRGFFTHDSPNSEMRTPKEFFNF